MANRKNIEQEVDKTLTSLEGVQRAVSDPYIFTRIRARLEKEERNFWSTSLSFLSRPAVALTAIIIVLLVNTIIFFEFRSEQVSPANEEEQLFANEYNLANNTIYDSTIEPQ